MELLGISCNDYWAVKFLALLGLSLQVRRRGASAFYEIEVAHTLLRILGCLDVLLVHDVTAISC